MDTILVKVDDIAAKKWMRASDEKKTELNSVINRIIKRAFDKNGEDFHLFCGPGGCYGLALTGLLKTY